MRFWDTSAIVPLVATEQRTKALQRIVEGDRQMLVWWTTHVECVSAISRLERGGELSESAAQSALDRIDSLRDSWEEVQPTDAVRRIARRVLRTHPLRAADALQVAAAVVGSEGRAETLTFVTVDARLAQAAEREGFTLESIPEK